MWIGLDWIVLKEQMDSFDRFGMEMEMEMEMGVIVGNRWRCNELFVIV